MAVRTREAKTFGVSGMGSKAVALLAWSVGVWTTYLFLKVLTEGAEWTLWGALVLQLILTVGESPLWRGKGRWWHFVVLLFDATTNVGGFYVYVMRLDKTDSWDAFNAGLGTVGGLHPLAGLLVSLVLGVLTAAAPEFLWRQE